MLSKLLKYEFKSTARSFIPIYIAIFAVSIFMNLGMRFPNFELMLGLIGIALFALFVALVVITIMTIINRFKNNLLSDEGYLMFTLPVSTGKLILSKLISAISWIIFSGIIAIISAVIIVANKEFVDAITQAMFYMSKFLNMITGQHITWLILGIICLFTQLIYFILLVYTSLSVSQMAIFNKHRGFVSFAAFIILYTIVNFIITLIFSNILGDVNFTGTQPVTPILLYAITSNVILCAIMFTGTYYLLKNHLNIE